MQNRGRLSTRPSLCVMAAISRTLREIFGKMPRKSQVGVQEEGGGRGKERREDCSPSRGMAAFPVGGRIHVLESENLKRSVCGRVLNKRIVYFRFSSLD